MERKKLFSFIRDIELFSGLTDQEIENLVDSMEEKNYERGSLLFEENGPRTDIFIIYQGEVELFKTPRFGSETKLAYFRSGDFLGEGSWASNSPHSTSARALKETIVLSIKKGFFDKNGPTAVKIFSNIARVISRRMRHANNRMLNVAAQYESGQTRKEHDLLGYRDVPNEYLYGVQTLRASENFEISGVTLNFYPDIIRALAMVKMAAAKANHDLGLLDKTVADAIVRACNEIMNGKYHLHFIVDMIQGGAGTSTNMNANEVIANRALEIMGHKRGEYKYCHPNNHVNLSQSTNDAYPTAVKIALVNSNKKLLEILERLVKSFYNKSEEI